MNNSNSVQYTTSENIEEQKLQEFVNKLTDPKILLSFIEIEEFMKSYKKYLLGYYSPFYNFLEKYIAKKYNVVKDSSKMRKFLRNELGYEIITQELIDELQGHIGKRLDVCDHISILEVGAGNGKLSYHLRKTLDVNYPNKCSVHAIDTGYEAIPSIFDIECISDREAIKKYNPDIIIRSWMPQKPFASQLLERKYGSQIASQLTTKNSGSQIIETILGSSDYQQFDKELSIYREERRKYPEYSAARRKESTNLKEYILIGPLECCGDKEHTFGRPFAEDEWFRDVKSYGIFSDNKEMFEKSLIEKPSYYDDGYFIDVSNFDKLVNEEDITRYIKYNKSGHLVSSSFLISFKNKEYLSGEEIDRLENEHKKFTEQVNADDLPF